MVLSNVTFKPMLVDANLYPDVTYDDYESFGIITPSGKVEASGRYKDADWRQGNIESSGSVVSTSTRIYMDSYKEVKGNIKIAKNKIWYFDRNYRNSKEIRSKY